MIAELNILKIVHTPKTTNLLKKKKNTGDIILNDGRQKVFPTTIRNKTRSPTFIISIQHCTGSFNQINFPQNKSRN